MRTLLSTVLLRKLPAPTPTPGLMFIVCTVSMGLGAAAALVTAAAALSSARAETRTSWLRSSATRCSCSSPRLSACGVCACRINGRHSGNSAAGHRKNFMDMVFAFAFSGN